jgi:hypothetical protein
VRANFGEQILCSWIGILKKGEEKKLCSEYWKKNKNILCVRE